MKKIFYIFAIAIVTLLTSCQKDPIGKTAVQEMSGQWYVTCDLIDANGEVVATGSEFFGYDDRFLIITYNNSTNKENELIVDDREKLYIKKSFEFSIKCISTCDLKTYTFSAVDAEDIRYGDTVTLSGKIVKDGTKTPSGQKADYIEFTYKFGSDPYPAKYGYDHYRLSGWRYTGFAEDD